MSYFIPHQTYEYAMAQSPGQEAHGGSTYCALATLSLMGHLDVLPHKDRLIQWLIERQVTGFQGVYFPNNEIRREEDMCLTKKKA